MELLSRHLGEIGVSLAPVAYCFLVIAAVTKRGALLATARRGWRESRTNAGLFLVNYVLFIPVMAAPFLAVNALAPNWQGLEDRWSDIPFALQVLLALALIDVTAYWRHRFEHTSFMWRFHATHHADEALNWFSVKRKHPVGKLFEVMIDIVPALMIGSPLIVIMAAQLIRGWWGYLIHADVPWTLGPLGAVLVSPAAHRLHHIRDETLMGSNYGNTLTLWDRAFGTWTDPAPHVGCATGIADGTRGVWGELMRPWLMGPVADDHGSERAAGERVDRALQDHGGGMAVDHRAAFPAAGVLRDELALCTPGGPAFVPQQHRQPKPLGNVAGVSAACLGTGPLGPIHVAWQADNEAGGAARGGHFGELAGVDAELAPLQGLAGGGKAPARVASGNADGLRAKVEPYKHAAAG